MESDTGSEVCDSVGYRSRARGVKVRFGLERWALRIRTESVHDGKPLPHHHLRGQVRAAVCDRLAPGRPHPNSPRSGPIIRTVRSWRPDSSSNSLTVPPPHLIQPLLNLPLKRNAVGTWRRPESTTEMVSKDQRRSESALSRDPLQRIVCPLEKALGEEDALVDEPL